MAARDRAPVLLALAGLLATWQLLSTAANLSTLPGPGVVALAFVNGLPNGLAWHLAVSAYRVVISIVVAVVFAAPLGLALGQNKKLDRLVAPLVYLTYPVPKIVLLPVVLVFLGLGDVSKVFMISLILFFQVLVVVRDASNGVRPELVNSVRSLGAGVSDMLRYVYLPACLPAILTALRVTTGTAIAVLFFVESFATNAGLGYYIIVESWGRVAYPEMYAGVVAMSLLGVSLYAALDHVERRTCRWVRLGA